MRLSNRKGSVAVEFALILPIVVLLAMTIIELSVALFDKAVITNASREGARAGIVARLPPRDPNAEDLIITQVVNNYCSNYLITFSASNPPVITVSRAGFSFGDDLTVQVAYNYGFLVLPNFLTSLANPLQLNAKTVMKME